MSALTPQTGTNFPSQLRLDGRCIVVLGAGQGIGVQTAIALSQAGASVFCVDRDESLAKAIAAEVGGSPCEADVTDRSEMQRVFSQAQARYGRVNGVVDIVGMANIKPLEEIDDDAWNAQFDIVLRHAFLTVQLGGAAIAANGGGTLAFVGSMAGDRFVDGEVAYGTAKAALHHLVRCAAAELGQKQVRVNALAPGFIRTPRLNARLTEQQWSEIGAHVPLGRAAYPAEIAGPLLFLTSDLSSHITGQVLAVDGGTSIVAAIPKLTFGPAPVTLQHKLA